MVRLVSSPTELMNWYVINQRWERKFAGIFTNISTASSDPDATLSTRSKRLLKLPNPSRSKKWWRNFQNLSLRWGFARAYYNFCEHTRRLYFPKHNNWFYRPISKFAFFDQEPREFSTYIFQPFIIFSLFTLFIKIYISYLFSPWLASWSAQKPFWTNSSWWFESKVSLGGRLGMMFIWHGSGGLLGVLEGEDEDVRSRRV